MQCSTGPFYFYFCLFVCCFLMILFMAVQALHAAWAFLQLRRAGAALQWGRHGLLTTVAPLVLGHGLQSAGLSVCATWAQTPHGTWNLPGPGIKQVSSTLAGGFLTAGPPMKSPKQYFKIEFPNPVSKNRRNLLYNILSGINIIKL